MNPKQRSPLSMQRARVKHAAALLGFVWFLIAALQGNTQGRSLKRFSLRSAVRCRRWVRRMRVKTASVKPPGD